MDPKQNPACPCKRSCPRHGDCAACRAYHKDGETTCQRLAGKQKKDSKPSA